MELKSPRVELVGSTFVVFLSRPERRNAWTGRMHTEYRWALQQAESDESVKVIVVTGDPEGRAFCVGADTGALACRATRSGPPAVLDPLLPKWLPHQGSTTQQSRILRNTNFIL